MKFETNEPCYMGAALISQTEVKYVKFKTKKNVCAVFTEMEKI